MIEDLRIELPQMMENAGRSLAELAVGLYRPTAVTVLAGTGGNGGGGLVAARHLINRGVSTTVVLSRSELDGTPGHQLAILKRMGVSVAEQPSNGSLIIDALIGYSLRGDPRGRTAELIEWANSSVSKVLSLDTPSGLDVTTGEAATPSVQADATLTLALPKVGLRAAPQVGRLFLADISVPPEVYGAFGMHPGGIFAESQIVELLR